MARKWIVLFSFWQIALCSLFAGELRVGVASRIVTPDPLLPVSGGVGPSHPTSRKEGDLEVRAIVFAEGETRVAIVSADFLGFPALLGNKARAKVKAIPPENILIGATHTDRKSTRLNSSHSQISYAV